MRACLTVCTESNNRAHDGPEAAAALPIPFFYFLFLLEWLALDQEGEKILGSCGVRYLQPWPEAKRTRNWPRIPLRSCILASDRRFFLK
jgi:hypothetical protein